MKRVAWLCLTLLINSVPAFSTGMSSSAPDPAHDRAWLRLLHYQGSSGSWQSSIESPPFFQTQEGLHSPEAEWQALLQASMSDQAQDVACKFPARVLFFENHFQKSWPTSPCAEYLEWKKQLSFRSLSLVFSTAYAGNPASVVGHNFLKINIQDAASELALLDYGLAFLAHNDVTDGPVAYAWNGLTGGYPGFFVLEPYYELVNTYAYAENRDLWEFEFKVSPQEREFFLAHLWELIHFASAPYYFTHVNCSSMLLEVMEAMKPAWELKREIKGIVLPQAVMRTVSAAVALDEHRFWPSQRRVFASRWELLNQEQQDKFQDWRTSGVLLAIADDPLVLDLAIDQLNLNKAQMKREDQPTLLAQETQILLARSRLPSLPLPPLARQEISNNPLLAHGIHKFSATLNRYDDESYVGAKLRFGLHDLLDAPQGFNPYYHINFLELSLAAKPEESRPFYAMKWIDLMSLNPFQAVEPMASWSTSWSFGNSLDQPDENAMQVQGSYGLSWETQRNRSLLIAMPDLRLAVHKDGLPVSEQTAGLRFGWFYSLTAKGRQYLELRPNHALDRTSPVRWDWSLEQRWELGGNRQLEWRLAREHRFQGQIGLGQFF